MEFTVRNCNNIDTGTINVTQSKLNLKFGINGTGKSTISKAIQLSIVAPDKLEELTPFKLRNVTSVLKPEVDKPDDINSILIFNEEYLNQFLYREDELILNSFEIFIQTQNYKQSILRIEELLTEIKTVFSTNKELEQIITDFESLSNSFKITQTGLSKTSPIFKSLEDRGNKIENRPDELKVFSAFIKSENCTSWLEWQMKGGQFDNISDDCPYCTSSILEKKETIKSVSKTYDRNVIKNLNIITEAIQNLGQYFSDEAKRKLEEITKQKSGLNEIQQDYIFTTKRQIDILLPNLRALKEISSNSFREDEKAEEKLQSLIIDIELFDKFNSTKSKEIINSLNNALQTVLKQIRILQGEIDKQKNQTKKTIKKHQKDINNFLKNAGYTYKVEIIDNKLKLKHKESNEKIAKGNQYLSFGEKNAFALVLFMYQALSENPDIIILDDPISSFDKNKKYAIIDMLFGGNVGSCLKGKTVLMLTHDIEPVIDINKTLWDKFSNTAEARFLSTKAGALTEKQIRKSNLLSFGQICKRAILSENNIIIKLIYLRRNYELIDDLGDEYQVLSNLFKKRDLQNLTDKRLNNSALSVECFTSGVSKIKGYISDFNYESVLSQICKRELLTQLYLDADNSYIKLHLFRMIIANDLKKLPNVLQKFINESYHIENELICQLDPLEFDLIPDYITTECDKIVNSVYTL